MKKSEIKKLDQLWSKKVKERAGYKCEYCLLDGKQIDSASGVWLNSAHIIGRRHRATRWGCWIDGIYDLCGHSLCFNDHKQYDEHGYLEADIRKIVIGEDRYEKIRQIAKTSIAKNQCYEQIKGWLNEL